MQSNSAFVRDMFHQQLKNCRLAENEVVAVVSDLSSRGDYSEAAMAAAKQLGADVFQITIPEFGRGVQTSEKEVGLGGMLRLSDSVVKALKNANLILDHTLEGFIHTKERAELLGSGVRILRVGAQPPQVLSRVMCWTSQEAEKTKKEVTEAGAKLSSAKKFHVFSDAGTDLTCVIDPKAVFASYGFSDVPGRWDVWGQNMVSDYPSDSNGVVVINSGDYNVTPFAMYHDSPIKLSIENNFVVEIKGDGFDAKLMRRHMESYNEKNSYAISHVGWGLNKKANWFNMATYDRSPDERGVSGDEGRVFWGNFLFSTGPNHHVGRFTKCHYDIALLDCTIDIDGKRVVERGKVI